MVFENTFTPTDWGLYSGILVFVLIFAMFIAGGSGKKVLSIILGALGVATFIFWWTFELDEPHEIRVYLASESAEGIKINQHFVTAGSEYQFPDGRKIKLAMAQDSSNSSAYSDTKSVVINETTEDLFMTNVNAGVARREEAILTDLTSITPGEVKEFSHMIDTEPSRRSAPPSGAYHNPDRKDGEDLYWLNWVNHYYQVKVLKRRDGTIGLEDETVKGGDNYTFSNGTTIPLPEPDKARRNWLVNDSEKTLTVYRIKYVVYQIPSQGRTEVNLGDFEPWSMSEIDLTFNYVTSRKVGPPKEIKIFDNQMEKWINWLTWDED